VRAAAQPGTRPASLFRQAKGSPDDPAQLKIPSESFTISGLEPTAKCALRLNPAASEIAGLEPKVKSILRLDG
jgi:hypothetical protein